MTDNTQDISKFGYRETRIAAELLNKYCDNPEILGDGIRVEFNPISGNVFLVDSDFKVAMMNGDNLEEFFICPYCGHEGFKEAMPHEPEDDECTEYLKQIGIIVG